MRTHSRVTFYNLEVYILLHNKFSNCILTKFTSFLVTIIVFSYDLRCRAVGSTSVILKNLNSYVVSLKLSPVREQLITKTCDSRPINVIRVVRQCASQYFLRVSPR